MINKDIGEALPSNMASISITKSDTTDDKLIQLELYRTVLTINDLKSLKLEINRVIAWAKTKPAKPIKEEDHLVYCQPWLESEAGWGKRPDGWTMHLTLQDCKEYIADYWKREKASNPSGETPTCYSRPDGEPYLIIIKTSLFKKLEGFKGAWGGTNSAPPLATAEQIRAMVDAARISSRKKTKTVFKTTSDKIEASRAKSDRAVKAEVAKNIRSRRAALIK